MALWLGACANNPQTSQPTANYPELVFTARNTLPADFNANDAGGIYDPWEGMNKRIYNFNYHFDKHVFLPVVRG